MHLGVLALLLAAQFFLPPYHHTNVARIMVMAAYAVGYNLLLGYTGLLSLGHAMFFAAGLYGAGLTVYYLEFGAIEAFASGIAASLALATAFGLVALRTTGVSFLIVTMMFGQACFLTALYFNEITLGDQGFVLSQRLRPLTIAGVELAFSSAAVKYNVALLVFGACLLASLAVVRSPVGRVPGRDPRERGAHPHAGLRHLPLQAGVAGRLGRHRRRGGRHLRPAVLIRRRDLRLDPVLDLPAAVGAVGRRRHHPRPLVGTAFMFYLVDISSSYTTSHLLVVGVALVILILWFPKGIMGTIREKWLPWLP